MAKLYFYYASMNAGKSTTLLQADFNYRERGMATMLWTAAVDDRWQRKPIASRIGLEADAHLFDEGTDLWARVTAAHAVQPLSCVLIDEAQFLSGRRCGSWRAWRTRPTSPFCAMACAPISGANCSPVRPRCWALPMRWSN
jgi:thymidine kinase